MRSLIFLCVALVSIVLAVYWQVGSYDFINLDDGAYVTGNENVKKGMTQESLAWAFTSFKNESGFWHPTTWLSHMADVELYGMNPKGHHLIT